MNRQQEITNAFKNNYETILKKSEIIESECISYVNNTGKWVGETLSRMIKNGSLTRVKTGYYRLGGTINNEDQLDIFK